SRRLRAWFVHEKLPTEMLALQDLSYTKPIKLNENALALPSKHAPMERPYFAPVA
ncbi:MAG: hypothetical protein HC817_09280, partial [Saprospiraceae bacterium]|nr:hypothetical protein [Saprospiraceae bacterium]